MQWGEWEEAGWGGWIATFWVSMSVFNLFVILISSTCSRLRTAVFLGTTIIIPLLNIPAHAWACMVSL